MKKLEKIYKALLYVLPLALMFSYWPVMTLGSSESMNFELSVPLLWLVAFDTVAVVMMWKRRVLLRGLKGKWGWIMLPIWLTLTVLWSLNSVRGVLTAGILWLLYLAGYGMWSLRGVLDDGFRQRWWKWFLGAALFACGWCVVQCVLDLTNVGREYSLMCAGCVSQMFGFPHPNGFAIEPQFMGNLLLAPAMVAVWLITGPGNIFRSRPRPSGPSPRADGAKSRAAALRNAASPEYNCHPLSWTRILLLAVFSATLFLTLSRGAIYAFVIGMVAMSGVCLWRAKHLVRDHKLGRTPSSVSRTRCLRALSGAWLTVILAFVFTLNLQGVMAEVGPTNDTYVDGVAKVLSQLSLGAIDIRSEDAGRSEETQAGWSEELEVVFAGEETEVELVEKPVENSDVEMDIETSATEAVFDGYVEESTETRVKLTGAALEVWRKDFVTMMFGVGLGGAGQALYVNGFTDEPKEIVQNQYASLLLETGLVGVILLIVTLVLVGRAVWKSPARGMMVGLLVAYAVSLLFFAGLPNALQIYLMPMVLAVVVRRNVSSN